jgi:hypothetical protein
MKYADSCSIQGLAVKSRRNRRQHAKRFGPVVIVQDFPLPPRACSDLFFTSAKHGNLSATVSASDLLRQPDPKGRFARTLLCTRNGDDSTYHYTVGRDSLGESCGFVRPWRTALDGRSTEEIEVNVPAQGRILYTDR